MNGLYLIAGALVGIAGVLGWGLQSIANAIRNK